MVVESLLCEPSVKKLNGYIIGYDVMKCPTARPSMSLVSRAKIMKIMDGLRTGSRDKT